MIMAQNDENMHDVQLPGRPAQSAKDNELTTNDDRPTTRYSRYR